MGISAALGYRTTKNTSPERTKHPPSRIVAIVRWSLTYTKSTGRKATGVKIKQSN